MRPHGNSENGLNWEDGHIPYTQLASVLSEAAAGFAHLYAYGDSNCTFISQLLGRLCIGYLSVFIFSYPNLLPIIEPFDIACNRIGRNKLLRHRSDV